jgi:hypothetical protein
MSEPEKIVITYLVGCMVILASPLIALMALLLR